MASAGDLRLYNTLTKREEVFQPIEQGKVKMYSCGPTVYGRPHIGNYSSFLMADLLRRWLEVRGLQVTYVKNITDVGHLVADADEGEDKIEKQAKVEKVDPLSVARKYTEQYLEDEKALNMLEPAYRPKATETIAEMIATIQTLIEKGHAYETGNGVYFAVETFPEYGQLSGNTLDNLSAGARITVNEDKRHPADFALWKKCVGENAHHVLRWLSPWGYGFPGWHIECSAMSTKFLGTQIDIHTGGEDNIFPHHECEIAQSECSSGQKPFVRLWLHKRRIDIGSTHSGASGQASSLRPGSGQAPQVAHSASSGQAQKMSKSLGNVLTVPDISAMGFDPLDLRYLFLSVHYRTQLKFTQKGLDDARKARRKIVEWIEECETGSKFQVPSSTTWNMELGTEHGFLKMFADAMNSDLNTPGALAVVFEYMAWTRNQKFLSASQRAEVEQFIAVVRHTFGCFEEHGVKEIPKEVTELLAKREQARSQKDYAASDQLRDEIKKYGFDVRDTADGQKAEPLR